MRSELPLEPLSSLRNLSGLVLYRLGDIRLHALEAVRELNLPKYVLPLLGLCIGYAAENPGIKPRLPKEAVYFEEQYRQNLEPLIAEYDEIYAHYLKERPWNSRVGNWSQLAADFTSRRMTITRRFRKCPAAGLWGRK